MIIYTVLLNDDLILIIITRHIWNFISMLFYESLYYFSVYLIVGTSRYWPLALTLISQTLRPCVLIILAYTWGDRCEIVHQSFSRKAELFSLERMATDRSILAISAWFPLEGRVYCISCSYQGGRSRDL